MKSRNIRGLVFILIMILSLSACTNKNNETNKETMVETNDETVVETNEEIMVETDESMFETDKNDDSSKALEKELDSQYDVKVDEIANRVLDEEVVPGIVVLATKDNKIIFEKAYGYAQLNDAVDFSDIANPKIEKLENPRPMDVNTLFDLASVTKVTATTQAIMKLSYEGKLDVDDLVTKYIPDFGKNGKDTITIKELLTHTSGMPQWVPSFLYVDNDREKLLEFTCELEPIFEKGEYKYSDFGFITLGYIVENVSGMTLDQYVEEEIYKPLGMNNTFYKPLDHGIDKEKIAATSFGNPFEYRMVNETDYPDFGYDTTADQEAFKQFDGWRKYTLIGEVNDGNTGMASDGIAGHAGLYSNVEDLAILSQMMLNGGEYNGVRLYDQETIDKFRTNYLGEDNRGYGFELNKSYMGDDVKNAYGHNGFTGTHIVINPDENMSFIVLTNKQNLGLDDEGSYNGTFGFVNEIVNEFLK